jgi:hypothetical protein
LQEELRGERGDREIKALDAQRRQAEERADRAENRPDTRIQITMLTPGNSVVSL